MKRQDKYPETATFHFYNANPHNRVTGDCATRAISTALDIPYNQCVMEQATMQCEYGYDDADTKGIAKFLELKGWAKHPQPRKWDNTKYTVKEFIKEYIDPCKRYVVLIAGHCFAIIDGKV